MITFPTLREFLFTRDVLSRFYHMELPYKTAIKISRFLDNGSIIFDDYKKVEDEIFKKYAKLNDAGEITRDEHGYIVVDDAHIDDLNRDIDELHSSQLKYMFDEDNYLVDDDLKELSVSPSQLMMMKWMIIDTEQGVD